MIKLGRHSYAHNAILRGEMSDVIVGNFCSIAEGVVFDCGFQHPTHAVTTYPLSRIWSELPCSAMTKGDIVIGNDVWIGEGAMIMSGVTIGDGCIIGAREVVRSSMDHYQLFVKGASWSRCLRLPEEGGGVDWELIKRLRDIAWWEWDDERVRKNADLLMSKDIRNFIKNHE